MQYVCVRALVYVKSGRNGRQARGVKALEQFCTTCSDVETVFLVKQNKTRAKNDAAPAKRASFAVSVCLADA